MAVEEDGSDTVDAPREAEGRGRGEGGEGCGHRLSAPKLPLAVQREQ